MKWILVLATVCTVATVLAFANSGFLSPNQQDICLVVAVATCTVLISALEGFET